MIKMMEYMIMGKPIVAFDLPEHRVSAQDAAVYAQGNDPSAFASKIEELIDDPDRRRSMGEIGRERVLSQLAWEHQEGNLLAAYEAVTRVETSR
jgi:glycosyltransferase involved in cell wall biosynthesis